MARKAKNDATKDMTAEEKNRWDAQHSKDYIITVWNGGEHLRAANLAAEAEFDEGTLDDLAVLCPGIKDHMPAGPDEVRQKGTVPGNPTQAALDRFQIDESEVGDLTDNYRAAHDADEARAQREPKPAGKPSNDGIDGPTMHPGQDPLDHDGNGVKGGVKK